MALAGLVASVTIGGVSYFLKSLVDGSARVKPVFMSRSTRSSGSRVKQSCNLDCTDKFLVQIFNLES